MTGPIKTLLFSTLYPSSARPLHGIFVETRLRELLKTGAVDVRVVAPVPWFPSAAERWGNYAKMAGTPMRETRNEIEVRHPRYLLPPKVGMNLAPWLLAAASIRPIRQLIAEGFDFDLIDAHYAYPDGVAAAVLGSHFKRPVVITARGSDFNLIGKFALPRRMMQWAARRADASIGVCNALVDVLRDWQMDEERLNVIGNGVDLHRFRPLDRGAMRENLGIHGDPVLLSVGNLVEGKGHHLAIDAFRLLLSRYHTGQLVIVGEGVERQRLEKLASAPDLQGRVILVGAIPQQDLSRWYNAADVLVLASSREGWANVLLEAMACGTPVVATKVGGTPEVVRDERVGRLVEGRDGPSLAAGIEATLMNPPPRQFVRHYAEGFGWEEISRAQVALFSKILASRGVPGA